MKTTIHYEMGTCSRCGGSGHYSFNLVHGTTCYGCSGTKRKLTKAGAKARAAVEAFKAEHFSVPVEQLKAGDRIVIDGRARTLATVEYRVRGGCGHAGPDGVTVFADGVHLTYTKPIPSSFGPVSGSGYTVGMTVLRAVSGADWEAVVAFARTLKKGCTITETPE